MKLTPPKVITFWIAIILGVLGLLGALVPSIAVIGSYAIWFALAGLVLLVLGLIVKGL
jgi:hypothetical protein